MNALVKTLAIFLIPACVFAQPPAVNKETALEATTPKRGKFHVVFQEVVTSKQQKDWTRVYNAKVTLYDDKGKELGTFKGSTLPNDKPPKEDPSYIYSVVLSTGSLKPVIGERFYTWKRGLRADLKRPCLRLEFRVPTINVGSAREVDRFLSSLKDKAIAGDFRYAESILVHAGFHEAWRGSAGCLTIHPDDEKKFFEAIPDGSTGTLALYRGIEDPETKTSYNY